MKKVCVRVPEDRVADLKLVAEQMRQQHGQSRAPGWDAKLVFKIAEEKFGGTLPMMQHYGWPERGKRMMSGAMVGVKREFGSVEAFAKHHGFEA